MGIESVIEMGIYMIKLYVDDYRNENSTEATLKEIEDFFTSDMFNLFNQFIQIDGQQLIAALKQERKVGSENFKGFNYLVKDDSAKNHGFQNCRNLGLSRENRSRVGLTSFDIKSLKTFDEKEDSAIDNHKNI